MSDEHDRTAGDTTEDRPDEATDAPAEGKAAPGAWSPPPAPGKGPKATAQAPSAPGGWSPPPAPSTRAGRPAAPAPPEAPDVPAGTPSALPDSGAGGPAPGGWTPPPAPGGAAPKPAAPEPKPAAPEPVKGWSPPPAPGAARPAAPKPAEPEPAKGWSPPPPPGGARPAAPATGRSGEWSPPPPPATAAGAAPASVPAPPAAAPATAAPPAGGEPLAAPAPMVAKLPVHVSPRVTTDKTDVFVCTGCGIGEHLDAERLAGLSATELQRPGQVRPPLCIPEGLEDLRKSLGESDANRVVIAACSERVNHDVFSTASLGVDLVGRVNLRELVTWSTPPGDEAQYLAEDYLRMGITKTQWTRPPARDEREVETSLLVVGGGITGLTAALEAAGAGHDVHLVEREPELGGWTARFARSFPTRPPYRELEAPDIARLVEAATTHPRITVSTGATVSAISGEPGDLQVTLDQNGRGPTSFATGAVVLATGWQPEDAGLEHLGYGALADVITNVEFEAMAAEGRIVRPSDGAVPGRVAIVTRPKASDDHPGYSFGANVLDMASLKHALYVTDQIPGARAYLVYEDIVTPGQYESFYRRVQEEPGVYFTKGRVRGVIAGDDGRPVVQLSRSLLGADVGLPADLVVLATGMAPTSTGEPVLNLLYRQGPGLPAAKFGFSDSNFICFPYETRRTGVYAAGSVREPMDVALSREDAAGAALKAIQSLELIAEGRAAHPRAGDLSLPATRYQGCTKCGRCSEECPFSAIEVDGRGFPILNPERCRRCGICMGACPVRVISFEDYSVEQLSAMVKAIDFGPDPAAPRIVALACENDAYPAFDMAGINRFAFDAAVRVIPLRCLGSLNVAVVADALSSGVDGIMLMGCRSGDDYQCHFIQGSELADRRMVNVRETLNRLTIEPERVASIEIEISEYDRVPSIVGEFTERVRKLGPNPYKGF